MIMMIAFALAWKLGGAARRRKKWQFKFEAGKL
jgi:hypothetical protein